MLLGPGVERLTRDTVVTAPLGAQAARGFPDGVEAWRLVSVAEEVGGRLTVVGALHRARGRARAAPQHFARAARDSPGAPRHGLRARRGRQVAPGARVRRRRRALDDSHGPLPAVRRGRHVLGDRRDGEGGSRDHRRRLVDAAAEKLRKCCGDESGGGSARSCVGRARRGRRRTLRGGDRVGGADLGDGARRPPAARARLRGHPLGRGADARPDRASGERGQGRPAPDPLPRARRPARRAAEVGRGQRARHRRSSWSALPRDDSARARSTRSPRASRSSSRTSSAPAVLDTTEGNPLFIEETVRMLLESGGEPTGIPHTVQAMISARIDRLPPAEREVLRRAAVAGRTFWSGAIEAIGEDSDPVERDCRSSSTATFSSASRARRSAGEEAYRFKHVLIRDVAYAGLPKSSRALLHRQMAEWLAGARARGRARRDPCLPSRPRGGAGGGAAGQRAARARRGGRRGARAGGPQGARARGERGRSTPAGARHGAGADPSSAATWPRAQPGG